MKGNSSSSTANSSMCICLQSYEPYCLLFLIIREGRRMLRNKELQDFYSSENSISMIVSRMVKKTDHASRRGVIRIEVNIFIGKPKKEKPFKRSRS